jgi:PAS domain S-box-containing protein
MPPRRASGTIPHYAIALAAVALGLGAKAALNYISPQGQSPFLLLALIVIAAGWFGGAGPAIVATALAALGARWFFIEPRYSLQFTTPGDGANLLIFVVEGAFIALLCEGRLYAVRQNDRARTELEDRVRDRTAALSQANVVMQQEVDHRRQAEADLFRQREYLTALLATLAEGIVAVDAAGRTILINRAAVQMYGLPDDKTPYDQWDRYHQTFYADGVTPMARDDRPLPRILREQVVTDLEKVVVTRADGRRRDLLSTGRAILAPDGTRLGAVVAFRDITDRKRQEEELKRFTAQLERSNRELQDFASVASHDLQEPLRKIQAFGDRLRTRYEPALGPEGKDYLDRMLNAAGRMSTLISDLLTFSRVTTRAQPFKPVDLGEIARDVVSDLEARVEQTGGRVDLGPLPRIEADAMQIRQLLQNLIGNALKFHKPGERPVVRVDAEIAPANGSAAEGNVCRLTITDNGIGFDEKYLDRIFNVFQRLHGRNTYEGTGIGLAVCRKIAERHHGSVTARSVPGQGSTFVVTLPVRQPQEPAPVPAAGDATAHVPATEH